MHSYKVINFHEHPNIYTMDNCKEIAADQAVLLPVGVEENFYARMLTQTNPGKFIPFHWIDLGKPADAEIKRLRFVVENWGVRGIKFHPMVQHFHADDRAMYPYYEVCEELKLITTFHTGVIKMDFKYQLGVPMLCKYCDPINLDQVAFDFPDLKICIAHLGGNFIYNALVLTEKHDNIYMDTAFLGFFVPRLFPATTVTTMITHAVKVAGDEKVLFGGEGVTPDDIMAADIREDSKQKILYLNAEKLLSGERQL